MNRALAAWFVSPWVWNRSEDTQAYTAEMGDAFRNMGEEPFYERMAMALAQGQDISEARQFVTDHIREDNLPLRTLQEIGDDISVAVICRHYGETAIQPLSYYLPPDWDKIYQEVYRILYGQESEKPPEAADSTSAASEDQE